MSKYTKYVIAFVCLFIFSFIAVNVYYDNEMIMDGAVYDFIYRNIITERMTPVIKFITNIGDTLCIIVIALISLFVFRNKKINISIVVNLITATALNNILKLIFMRPRPDLEALVEESTYSFPSGHSMVSIIFYGYLIYLIYHFISNKKIKWSLIVLLSILIIVIGFSRIYLGVHYASDVIGAFTFGIAYLIIYIEITKRMIK